MVTWFTFSLSFLSFSCFSLLFFYILYVFSLLRWFIYTFMHLLLYLISIHIRVALYFYIFFFSCTYNFNLLSTSYNLSTHASRYHFFPIRYTYQLTHLTCSLYTCLSLYENIRPYYLCSLAFAFLISRVFDDRARVFERKKKMSYES